MNSRQFVCHLFLFISPFYDTVSSTNDVSKCFDTGVIFNCSNTGFTELPMDDDVSDNVEIIDLSHNHIHNVTDFYIPNAAATLSTLILSNNQISIITSESFKLLVNLVHLDLSGNLIEGSKLEEDMFYDLRKLKTLNLERNPLRQIKKNTFNFIQLTVIEHLDLSHSEISVLEASSIDLPSLEYLDLSWNKLDKLEEPAFRMLVSLHTLDMSHNNIRVIDALPSLPEIATWILDNNGLETLKLRDEIWNTAESLQRLSIQNNGILRFDKDSLPLDLDTLTDIDLSNNPIQCDCKMAWIKNEEISRENRNITIPCQYPKGLRGQNLLDIAIDDLTCSASLAHLLLLILCVVVLVLCVLLMVYFLCRKRLRRRKTKKPYRGDTSGDYTAVYTRDEDDVTVELSDNKQLINESREFDV